jgi:hypothetical protein
MKKINLASYSLTKLTIDNETYSIFDGVANFGGKVNLNCCSIDLDTDLAYEKLLSEAVERVVFYNVQDLNIFSTSTGFSAHLNKTDSIENSYYELKERFYNCKIRNDPRCQPIITINNINSRTFIYQFEKELFHAISQFEYRGVSGWGASVSHIIDSAYKKSRLEAIMMSNSYEVCNRRGNAVSCLASTHNILNENYEIIDHGRWDIMGRVRYVTQAIIKG